VCDLLPPLCHECCQQLPATSIDHSMRPTFLPHPDPLPGTLLTARLALATGLLAVNTAGGTHHAAPGSGSGFCIINDLAVTAKAGIAQCWWRLPFGCALSA
jgi:hypothetical protein